MLIYLVKCVAVLTGLWLARYFQLIPWSIILSICTTVIVPFALIVLTAIRAKQQTLAEITDVVAAPLEHQDSPEYAPAIRHRS